MQGEFLIQQYQHFQSHLKSRQRIRISIDQRFQAQLDIMQYVILSKFQKNAKSLFKQKNNKSCDKEFKRGFKQLLDVQKIYYYNMIVGHLENVSDQNLTEPPVDVDSIKAPGYSKSYSKIGWRQVLLKLDFDKRYLYVQRDNKLKAYDLNFYILRKSKATQYNSFVLQAINEAISEKGQQLHIGFKDVKVFRQWFEGLKKLVEYVFWEKIRNMLFPPEVVEMIVAKEEEVTKEERSLSKLHADNKLLSQSAHLSKSQQRLPSQTNFDHRLARSMVSKQALTSENQNESEEKSINSIEIKSQRSSIKQMIDCQEIDQQEKDCETFRSFVQLAGEDVLEVDEEEQDLRVMGRLLPEYELGNVGKLVEGMLEVYVGEGMRLFSLQANPKRLKTFLSLPKQQVPFTLQKFASLLCTPQFYKLLNPEIEQLHTKTILTADLCLILYQKNIPYNRLYRSRDFVFVRHIFSKDNKFYIVDKSVEDNNVPPFTTIVRGELTVVYEIMEEGGCIKINIDAMVENFGYLKDLQEMNINIKFFKGFEQFAEKVKKLAGTSVTAVFQMVKRGMPEDNGNDDDKSSDSSVEVMKIGEEQRLSEKMCTKIEEEIKQATSQLEQRQTKEHAQITISLLPPPHSKSQPILQSPLLPHPTMAENIQQLFQSVEKMQIQGELSILQPTKQLQSQQKIIRKFTPQGSIILNNDHLTKSYSLIPESYKQPVYVGLKNGHHPIWKGNWEFLLEGGLKFINQKQIEEQKNVLKFILSQVAKNLVSGKSILNISLPVDIFSSESNLQKFIYSMSYAPLLLQPACSMSELQRFMFTLVFGLTMSPMYLEMEKPFNPVIGETFQCCINGCPAYAEQISHHPPIAASMLMGRGYRVTAQIESKMKLNINSGTGYNAGVYRVKYDQNDEEICYMSPSGEVCGLAYGDRKFNFIGKAYAWCEKSGLFVEVVLNPRKGGFFGKQETPIDYMEGRVLQVKDSFLKQFSKSLTGLPKKADITKQLGKFHGRWNRQLFYQQQLLFSYETTLPLQLQYEQSPLPSDSNWREDITYRRLLQISSAQVWKERLEVQQREERKLREKGAGKK